MDAQEAIKKQICSKVCEGIEKDCGQFPCKECNAIFDWHIAAIITQEEFARQTVINTLFQTEQLEPGKQYKISMFFNKDMNNAIFCDHRVIEKLVPLNITEIKK
jgi:hypothetical protein